jgi:HEAT repeat protein
MKALSTLRKLSKDKDPWVRMNLVWALEKMDEPEPLEIGIGMLDDPDSRVQREVLKMLKSKSTNPRVQADVRQRLEEMLKRVRRERGWII